MLSRVDDYLIAVRFPGECLSVREFITPHTPMVRELYAEVARYKQGDALKALALWKWVVDSIEYPYNDSDDQDFHKIEAYRDRGRPVLSLETYDEFWEFPYEVISWGVSDCAGMSLLLASCLRNFIPPERVYVVVGNLLAQNPGGHAWVKVMIEDRWWLLETTLPNLRSNPWRVEAELYGSYQPVVQFNDVEIFHNDIPILPSCTCKQCMSNAIAIWSQTIYPDMPCLCEVETP